jgi:hypothetical protein
MTNDTSNSGYQALQQIYLGWHNGRRPLSGFIKDIQQLVSQEANKAATEAVRVSYRERSQLVSVLSRLYPSHTCTDDNEPDWLVVCIHTPNGQAGWHISVRDRGLFKHLKNEPNHYDGHTTEEKYRRLAALKAEGEKL